LASGFAGVPAGSPPHDCAPFKSGADAGVRQHGARTGAIVNPWSATWAVAPARGSSGCAVTGFPKILIFDEVMTGFVVRVWRAQQRFGTAGPCLGKVIGSLPIGAYGGRAERW
jgi:hypothetical protein